MVSAFKSPTATERTWNSVYFCDKDQNYASYMQILILAWGGIEKTFGGARLCVSVQLIFK